MKKYYIFADHVMLGEAVHFLKYGSTGFTKEAIQRILQETGLDRKTIVDTYKAIRDKGCIVTPEYEATYHLIIKAFKLGLKYWRENPVRVSEEDMNATDPSGYVDAPEDVAPPTFIREI